MSVKHITLTDPDATIDFNLMLESPHVVAYRIWTRKPDAQDWTKVAEGSTGDDVPDHQSLEALPDGGTILYWLAVGGHANTPFELMATLGQNGAVLPGGSLPEKGSVSRSGSVALKRTIVVDV